MSNSVNNLDKKGVGQQIVKFYRNGKSYYFKLNEEIHELNIISINKLKERLSVPFKVTFSGISRAQIGRIVGSLFENGMDVKLEKINDKTTNVLKFEASFTQQSKMVSVYEVPHTRSLYTRATNCNPFIYTEINSKKVLLEVTKDYAKNNPGVYYFLSSDLSLSERNFFAILYTELECDWIYRIDKSITNEQRRKRIRKK